MKSIALTLAVLLATLNVVQAATQANDTKKGTNSAVQETALADPKAEGSVDGSQEEEAEDNKAE